MVQLSRWRYRQQRRKTNDAEIDAAEAALAGWLENHPADIGMEDGFEQLATMREAAWIPVGAESNAGPAGAGIRA